jgi:hypothetical protein
MTVIPSKNVTAEKIKAAIHTALRTWLKYDTAPPPYLLGLLLTQEHLADSSETNPVVQRLAVNKVLKEHIEKLADANAKGAHILQERFIEGEAAKSVALRLNLSRDQVNRRQQQAMTDLTYLILKNELAARKQQAQVMAAALYSSSYQTLVGVEDAINTLSQEILASTGAHLLAITGIGGIGKSSLADQITRQLIPHFHFQRFVWLFIPSQDLPAEHLITLLAQELCPALPLDVSSEQREIEVRQLLKSVPHLVIVDNLEADISHLTPCLLNLAGPTKFLLTSRERPSSAAHIYTWTLSPLSLENATHLIRDFARSIGHVQLADATQAQLQPIYDTVGGNPQALKLVVGLTKHFAIPEILQDLVEVKFDETEAMYRHIYLRVWQSLESVSQAVLKAMPLVGANGATRDYITSLCSLEDREVSRAIQDLISRSLLEVHGSVWEKHRYNIHSLTRTFLQTEIIDWPRDSI